MQIQQIQTQNNTLPLAQHKTAINRQNFASGIAVQNYSTQTLHCPAAGYFHPSFCGRISGVKEFSELMDSITAGKVDKSFAINKMKKILPQIVEKCKIFEGEGFTSSVYKIDNKYVYKLQKRKIITYHSINLSPENKRPNLKTWYGKKLVDIDAGRLSILRNSNENKKFMSAGIIDGPDFGRRYESGIRRCAKIPQEAYDDVAKDFKALNEAVNPKEDIEKYYSFDYINPNNFMFSDKELRIVDNIEPTDEKNANNVFSMINCLLAKYTILAKCKFSEKLIEPRREILKKCFVACEKQSLPLEGNLYFLPSINNTLRLCKINRSWGWIQSDIAKIRKESNDPQISAKLVGEYFDNLFVQDSPSIFKQ